jgi:hypothetical protein
VSGPQNNRKKNVKTLGSCHSLGELGEQVAALRNSQDFAVQLQIHAVSTMLLETREKNADSRLRLVARPGGGAWWLRPKRPAHP